METQDDTDYDAVRTGRKANGTTMLRARETRIEDK